MGMGRPVRSASASAITDERDSKLTGSLSSPSPNPNPSPKSNPSAPTIPTYPPTHPNPNPSPDPNPKLWNNTNSNVQMDPSEMCNLPGLALRMYAIYTCTSAVDVRTCSRRGGAASGGARGGLAYRATGGSAHVRWDRDAMPCRGLVLAGSHNGQWQWQERNAARNGMELQRKQSRCRATVGGEWGTWNGGRGSGHRTCRSAVWEGRGSDRCVPTGLRGIRRGRMRYAG
ncbi:hypothetical protein DENSPDRAFT_671706 [Dentipellis sp. KUC8613]|nr:hypothetical protein DENSPDRAFT_671706 [Dentipellis sp. KUC8613]